MSDDKRNETKEAAAQQTKKGGRPPKDEFTRELDRARTKAWFVSMFEAYKSMLDKPKKQEPSKRGATASNQTRRKPVSFDALGRFLVEGGDKRFHKYRLGKTTPDSTTVINAETKLPGTRYTFDIGPPVDADHSAYLWKALGGEEQGLWEVLVDFDPAIEVLRYYGAGFGAKVKRITDRFDIRGPDGRSLIANDLAAVARGVEPNSVAVNYERGVLRVDLRLVAAVIATWRLCLLHQEEIVTLAWILSGLREKAIDDLVGPFGISEHIEALLIHHEAADRKKYGK